MCMYTRFMYTRFMYTRFMYTRFMYTGFMYTRFMYTRFMYTRFLELKLIILMHNTLRESNFGYITKIYSAQLYLLRLCFLVKSFKLKIRTKFFRSLFPNPLSGYVYGHDPGVMLLVYALAKMN